MTDLKVPFEKEFVNKDFTLTIFLACLTSFEPFLFFFLLAYFFSFSSNMESSNRFLFFTLWPRPDAALVVLATLAAVSLPDSPEILTREYQFKSHDCLNQENHDMWPVRLVLTVQARPWTTGVIPL
jgi:hypothetical protein